MLHHATAWSARTARRRNRDRRDLPALPGVVPRERALQAADADGVGLPFHDPRLPRAPFRATALLSRRRHEPTAFFGVQLIGDAHRCEGINTTQPHAECRMPGGRVRRRPNGQWLCDRHWMSGSYRVRDEVFEEAQWARARRIRGEE